MISDTSASKYSGKCNLFFVHQVYTFKYREPLLGRMDMIFVTEATYSFYENLTIDYFLYLY